jgi:ring-1,2-phenylacetyl-CoA epoxidase subunit PaaC
LFRPDPDALAAVDPGAVDAVLDTVLATAGLGRPQAAARAAVGGRAGRDGVHTEAMGFIVAELQSVARAYPDATW